MSNFLIDEDTDLLAAEFVLGTLDSEERANAQSLLRMDHGFIAMVRIWERRFGELHLMVEPVEPDAKIFQRIKAKIAEIAPSEPAPDGKPPAEGTPSPPPPEVPGTPATTEAPKPADAAVEAATPKPADGPAAVPADGTVPKPLDVPASGTSAAVDAEKAPALPPAPGLVVPGVAVPSGAEIPTTGDTQLGAEVKPVAEVGIPAPPLLPPSPLKAPDKVADKLQDRPERRPEITIDVVRSRGRWRMFGVFTALLLLGLVVLLAAWRFAPDSLPARLRPGEVMSSIGIQALPRAAPAVKLAPEGQFDE